MFIQLVEKGKTESLAGEREERACRKSVLPLLWSSTGMFSFSLQLPQVSQEPEK